MAGTVCWCWELESTWRPARICTTPWVSWSASHHPASDGAITKPQHSTGRAGVCRSPWHCRGWEGAYAHRTKSVVTLCDTFLVLLRLWSFVLVPLFLSSLHLYGLLSTYPCKDEHQLYPTAENKLDLARYKKE